MSTTYKIKAGDTLETISKKTYGSEVHADHILCANPGLSSNTLAPNTNIVIPDLAEFPKDSVALQDAQTGNKVQIFISGVKFEFWEEVIISKSIDGFDEMSFTSPFDPTAKGVREMFKPFTYKKVTVYIGALLFLTGVIVGTRPFVEAGENRINVAIYSLPGVLHDSTPPSTAYPLEFIDAKLDFIANSLIKPFGLKAEFLNAIGTAFMPVAIKPAEKIFSFLSKLARSRNLVMTSTTKGELRFWQSHDAGTPVSSLRVGASPVKGVEANFNEQVYYSHITGIAFADMGIEGGSYTKKNPFLNNVVRPLTFNQADTTNVSIQTAVEAKMGRMFANMLTYNLHLGTWRDPKNVLWEPNTTITLFAPGAYILKEYDFIIRAVEFMKTTDAEEAVLELIPPGGFNGKIPETLPWEL